MSTEHGGIMSAEPKHFRSREAAEHYAIDLSNQFKWLIHKVRTSSGEKREKAKTQLADWLNSHPKAALIILRKALEVSGVVKDDEVFTYIDNQIRVSDKGDTG